MKRQREKKKGRERERGGGGEREGEREKWSLQIGKCNLNVIKRINRTPR